jgi:predicted enzyme related to lactoylglutathione lyase
VVGWQVGGRPDGGMDYRMIDAGDGLVGGVMTMGADMIAGGARPGWLAYFGVADVDAKAAAVTDAGGQVIVPPTDIPGVGRFAFVTDPAGAPFYLMRGDSSEASGAFAPGRPGHGAWHELTTLDQDAALAFYGPLLGIEKTGAMPMGPMGDYSFLSHAGAELGAMMNVPEGRPPAWTIYFTVNDVDAAAPVIAAHGGQVAMGPMEVPGGQRIVVATDPHGAMFGLVSGTATA